MFLQNCYQLKSGNSTRCGGGELCHSSFEACGGYPEGWNHVMAVGKINDYARPLSVHYLSQTVFSNITIIYRCDTAISVLLFRFQDSHDQNPMHMLINEWRFTNKSTNSFQSKEFFRLSHQL